MKVTAYTYTHAEFPSPYGEVGFNRSPEGYECIRCNGVSVPLTGKLVLITWKGVLEMTEEKISFRPLTGKLVLITIEFMTMARTSLTRFRPLTGKLVLITRCLYAS